MLNILNLKLNNKKPFISYNKPKDIGEIRHYPSANKEWFNTIYAYNKNTNKLLFRADRFIISLIKSYFNIYSKKLEIKIRSPRLRTWRRRLSINRILVSRAELKHTNDKVVITLFIYNRQEKYYYNKILKITKRSMIISDKELFINKIRLIKIKALKVISKVKIKKDLIIKRFSLDKKFFFKDYETGYYKNFLFKSLRKEMLYMHYKQILYLNKSKFENTLLLPLKTLLKKVYNKKVEVNIVNLKYLHLNSDIFTQVLAIKLRNRKNRLYRVLKASLINIKLPYPNKLAMLNDMYDRQKKTDNLKINTLIPSSPFFKGAAKYNDIIDNILGKLFKLNLLNEFSKNSDKIIINSIKDKSISGMRVEASGRLSKRITAARSVFKKKYIGTLKNIDSSYKGFSSVILRGHVKSNLQYTKIKSKTRIGSFGLKGWISSN